MNSVNIMGRIATVLNSNLSEVRRVWCLISELQWTDTL